MWRGKEKWAKLTILRLTFSMRMIRESSHHVILDTWLLFSYACSTQQSMTVLSSSSKECLISCIPPTTLTFAISSLASWTSTCKLWKTEPGISGPRLSWSLSSSLASWKLSSSWRFSSLTATSLQWSQTLSSILKCSWYSFLFSLWCSPWSLMSFQGMKLKSIKRLAIGLVTSSPLLDFHWETLILVWLKTNHWPNNIFCSGLPG